MANKPILNLSKCCIGWREGEHCDAGLAGCLPVLNSIFQVLFHVPNFTRYIIDNVQHRRCCKSLLNCFTCGLYRLHNSMKAKDVSHPNLYLSKFIVRYKGADGCDMLNNILLSITLEYVQRNQGNAPIDELLSNCPINVAFEGSRICTGDCTSCGTKTIKAAFHITRLKEVPDTNFDLIVQKALIEEQCIPCCCGKDLAAVKTTSVNLPPYIFLHCTRNFDSNIHQSFNVHAHQRYLLMACMDEDQCFTICPDKNIRLFQGAKVHCTSFVNLLKNTRKARKLLVLYRQEFQAPETLQILVQPKKAIMKQDIDYSASKGNNFLGMDEHEDEDHVDEDHEEEVHVWDFPSDLENPESDLGVRSKATQTYPPHFASSGTQANIERCVTEDAAVQVNLFSYDRCSRSKKFKFFTGVTKEHFEVLYDLIGGDKCISRLKFNYKPSTPEKGKKEDGEEQEDLRLNYRDRLFLFLVRLRRGLPIEELAWLTSMSPSHTAEICYCMTRTVAESMKILAEKCFPSAAMQALSKPPQMFPFRKLRVILDGVEFRVETPSNFEMQGNTFSPYKAANTMRFIVGISCSGATIYVSPAAEGHLSEKDAVLKSGLLQKLDKGDLVMTDRGFDLASELHAVGAIQLKPPNKRGDRALTPQEEILTKAIAPVRIYTEHAMAEIKDNRLLQGTIPAKLYPMLPDLVFIAAYMRNFSPTRIIGKSFRNNIDGEDY